MISLHLGVLRKNGVIKAKKQGKHSYYFIVKCQAFYAGTPTLSIIPKRGEEESCPSVLQGQTPCAYTTDQIESELNKYKYKSLKKTQIPKNNNIGRIIESLLSS